MMSHVNSASVIIPTWNGIAFVKDCLDALFKQTHAHFEVIVVDNASTDGTADFIADNYSKVILVRNDRNLGFAAGVNVGLRRATGEFLVLLNQDTVVEPDWLAELVTGMSSDEQVGIGGCKILDWSGEKIWHTGVTLAGDRKFPTLRGAWEVDEGQYDTEEYVESVVGAAFAIRRELLERVGLFDESFHFYLEDTDYCRRAQEAGYRIKYFPLAVLRHYVAASLKRDSYEALYRFHFSRLLFLLKYYELDWFCNEFMEAEEQYLKARPSLTECQALRHVYMDTALRIAQGGSSRMSYSKIDSAEDADKVLEALTTLRNRSFPSMPEPIQPLIWEKTDDWHIEPLEFQSDVPIAGDLIAGVRQTWGNVAAKWFEQNLIHQQNVTNQEILSMFLKHIEQLQKLSHQIDQLSSTMSTLQTDMTALSDQIIELTRRTSNDRL